MKKGFVTLLLTACLLIGTTGCTVTIATAGEASWEAYMGVRTKQHSDVPAKVEIQFGVVDSLLDGKVSPEE